MALKQIKDLELDIDLNSCEGLDINYISSIRTNYLINQHQTIITQMQFADAKAGAMIALIGFLSFRGPIKIEEISNAGFFEGLFFAAAGIALLFSLLTIFPRFPSKSIRKTLFQTDRWSWPGLAGEHGNTENFTSYIRTAEVSQLIHSISASNCYVAKILLSKYQMLRLAFLFGIASIMLLGIRVLDLI